MTLHSMVELAAISPIQQYSLFLVLAYLRKEILNNRGKKFLAKVVGLNVLYMRGVEKASSLSALQTITFVIYADR